MKIGHDTLIDMINRADALGEAYHFVLTNGISSWPLLLQVAGDWSQGEITLKLHEDGTWSVDWLKPPPVKWNNARALTEGWDLFDVDGRWQLQNIDDPQAHAHVGLNYTSPKFDSDAGALIYVAVCADQGSTYHRRALEMIGQLVS